MGTHPDNAANRPAEDTSSRALGDESRAPKGEAIRPRTVLSPRLLAAVVLHTGVTIGIMVDMLARPAHAQLVSGGISLIWPSRISRNASALPRLRDADDEAARRINAALAAADHRLRGAISQCAENARNDGDSGSEWDRTVTVAMAGPSFLSVITSDSAFCGGVHPNFQTIAFTFDLQTGTPVNWAKLLPSPLVETTTTEDAMEGTTLGLIRSKLLVTLGTDPSEDCGMGDDATFQLWPDTARKGVNFAWSDPPHANENCGEPAVLDIPTLRRYGASASLVQALGQAGGTAERKSP